MPVSPAYTSVSFYTRTDVAYYAINDRAAGRRVIELDLMTTEQRAELPEDEDVTAADRLIVESPTHDRPDRDPGAGAGAGPDAGGARRARPPRNAGRSDGYFATTARWRGIGTAAGTATAATGIPRLAVGTRTLSAVRCCRNLIERSASTASGEGTATTRRSSAN